MVRWQGWEDAAERLRAARQESATGTQERRERVVRAEGLGRPRTGDLRDHRLLDRGKRARLDHLDGERPGEPRQDQQRERI